ncbi:hypothetical protein HG530_015106 [Fusarium avenaceum]|nr:hypothetical protein HG530_015106 [Fusarium avenaceum]
MSILKKTVLSILFGSQAFIQSNYKAVGVLGASPELSPSIVLGCPAPRAPFLLLLASAVLPAPLLVASRLGLADRRGALSLRELAGLASGVAAVDVDGKRVFSADAEILDVSASRKGIKVPFHDTEGTALGLSIGGRVHVDGNCLAGKETEDSGSELHD